MARKCGAIRSEFLPPCERRELGSGMRFGELPQSLPKPPRQSFASVYQQRTSRRRRRYENPSVVAEPGPDVLLSADDTLVEGGCEW